MEGMMATFEIRRFGRITRDRKARDDADAASPTGLIRLQRDIGNQAVQRILASRGAEQHGSRLSAEQVQRQGSGPQKEATEAAGPTPEEKEKLAKFLVSQLKGKKPASKSQGGKIVKSGVKAALKTKPGKKLVKKLFKGKARPAVLMLTLGANVAAWLAKETDTLSTPSIPIGKRVSFKAELKGTAKKPKSVMVFVEVRW